MIGGMPNLGKSTVINKLRQQSPKIRGNYVTKVTKMAATTQHLSGFRVSTEPNMWIIDTPGLMVPSIIENDMAIKLSLVGCIRDKILGLDVMVELMLESLNKYNQNHFAEFYHLKYQPKNAGELVNMVREKYLEFDHARTCQRILDDFREGKLGKITLDEVDLSD